MRSKKLIKVTAAFAAASCGVLAWSSYQVFGAFPFYSVWAFCGLAVLVTVPAYLRARAVRVFDPFAPEIIFGICFFAIYVLGSVEDVFVLQADVGKYLALSSIGYASFLFGLLLASPIRSHVELSFRGWGARWAVLLPLLLGLAATIFMVAKVGAPAFSEEKLIEKLDAREQVSSWTMYLIRVAQFAVYLLFANVLVSKRDGCRVSAAQWAIVFFLSVSVLFINFLPGWRGPVLLMMVNFATIYNIMYRSFSFRAVAIAVIPLLFVTFGWGFVRVYTSDDARQAVDYLAGAGAPMWQAFLIWATHQFSVYFFGFKVSVSAYSNDFLGLGSVFSTTLATALPGKQEAFGEQLKSFADLSFSGAGLNPTILGEPFGEMGIAGIVIYLVFFGWALGRLYRSAKVHRTAVYAIAYAYLLSVLCLGVMTGVLGQASYFFHFFVMSGLFVLAGIRVRKERRWNHGNAKYGLA